jgi:hypothetical protein
MNGAHSRAIAVSCSARYILARMPAELPCAPTPAGTTTASNRSALTTRAIDDAECLLARE